MSSFIDIENDFVDFSLDNNSSELDEFVTKLLNNKKDYKKTEKNLFKKKKKRKSYMRNGKKIKFDRKTEVYYKNMRKVCEDPIICERVQDGYCFYNKWDPYTGQILEKDPFGPLVFDPDSLIHTWYTMRLNNLWIEPSDEEGGYYEGYYGEGVGAGENFYISGRGNHPEWNLFRLPIIDCYLTDDHNHQFVTMGPKISDEELIKIYKQAENNVYRFGKKRPNLIKMKYLYEQAISERPELHISDDDICNMSEEELKIARSKQNRKAIDKLKEI